LLERRRLKVLTLYNQPSLSADDPDAASEAGVLESVAAVTAALANCGHEARSLAIENQPERAAVVVAQLEPVDVVINLFEGFGGVGRGEAEIAGLLELCGHAITGSPPDCLALVRNKARTKWLLAGAGIPTAEFLLIDPQDELDPTRFEPLLAAGQVIVKPANEDASLGISLDSIVDNGARLAEQITAVRERYGPVLVERFISGREFNVGVLALPNPETLPLAEIEFGAAFPLGKQIVTYDAKWTANSDQCVQTPVRCPAEVSPQLAAEIRRVALAAFRISGCRDYARVDLRVDSAGQAYVLEVNGNPDISPTAGFARALRVAGIEYDTFIDRLVRTTHATRSRLRSIR
jgi:D-alanine-D-alanine ligase